MRRGVVAPDARVAIGLQFLAYRKLVRLAPPTRGTAPACTRSESADERLDVVADFVCDDVGLREIAWRAKALIELAEERQVQVDLVIAWAVERPDRG